MIVLRKKSYVAYLSLLKTSRGLPMYGSLEFPSLKLSATDQATVGRFAVFISSWRLDFPCQLTLKLESQLGKFEELNQNNVFNVTE